MSAEIATQTPASTGADDGICLVAEGSSEFRETQNAVMELDASKGDILPKIYQLSTASSYLDVQSWSPALSNLMPLHALANFFLGGTPLVVTVQKPKMKLYAPRA